MTPLDTRPDITDAILVGIASTDARPLNVDAARFHKWRAERGHFSSDLGPLESCRACTGRHLFRTSCAFVIDTLDRSPL